MALTGPRETLLRPGAALRRGAAAAVLVAFGVALGAAVTADTATTSAAGQGAAVPSAVDVGFCQDMIVHHEQAVLMAQLVRSATTDSRVAALAAGIEADQLLDIGAMRGYLALWRSPVLTSGPPMTWMGREHSQHKTGGATMPGLATIAELNALRSANGAARDDLFLALMLRHHEGGMSMLTEAAQRAAVPAVRELASRLAFHQQEEIGTVMTLLAAREVSAAAAVAPAER